MYRSYDELDKLKLIGGCSRLPMQVDADKLVEDINAIPEAAWAGQGGRVGVHSKVSAVFLRGYAPYEGDKPIEDRELIQFTPYINEIITNLIPAQPLRCLIAKLHAGDHIALHCDNGEYFRKTIRIHIPVVTNEHVKMYAGKQSFHMQPDEVWALNNSGVHGARNADAELSRSHIICDFLPEQPLLDLLEKSNRDLGSNDLELMPPSAG